MKVEWDMHSEDDLPMCLGDVGILMKSMKFMEGPRNLEGRMLLQFCKEK